MPRDDAEATGVVEKGYFHTTGLFSGKRIQLSFTSAVSTAWRTAMTAAKNKWNSKTPMFSRDPGGARTINSNYSNASCGGSIENMTASQKAYPSLHEMGHVLGYAHPPPNPTINARVHIDGTATNTGLLEPSYVTVMAQGCGTRTTLAPGDILSAQKKYPSCIAACENNCTFSGDPGQIGLCQAACPAQCGG